MTPKNDSYYEADDLFKVETLQETSMPSPAAACIIIVEEPAPNCCCNNSCNTGDQ